MPICERCGKEHDGSYGSGRFCSKSCANRHAYTPEKRAQISQKISNGLKRYSQLQNPDSLSAREKKKVQRQLEIHDRLMEIEKSDEWALLKYDSYDFHNLYAISKHGDVMNVNTGRLLKPYNPWGKYKFYVLSLGKGKQIELAAHRMVAKTFIPNPDNLPIVNHKDEDCSNNCVENLEWCTKQYNNTYNNAAAKRGIKEKGRPSKNRALSPDDVCFIREHANQYTQKELAEMFCSNKASIRSVIRREYYKDID